MRRIGRWMEEARGASEMNGRERDGGNESREQRTAGKEAGTEGDRHPSVLNWAGLGLGCWGRPDHADGAWQRRRCNGLFFSGGCWRGGQPLVGNVSN